ncbi:Ankyrin repeat protein SKIP35 [Bienertia sinuspersici]
MRRCCWILDNSCRSRELKTCFRVYSSGTKMENDMGREGLSMMAETKDKEQMVSEMDIDYSGTESPKFEIEDKFSELGEGSNVVFAREGPLYMEDSGMAKVGCYGAKKQKSKAATRTSQVAKKGNVGNENKLSRQDRIELGKLFQSAVSSHDWDLAESLILFADPLTLNDFLCISLDSIWFLTTYEELYGITGLIKKIIANGAYDFTRAALRTSFLASCVSACQSRTMDLADTVKLQLSAFKTFLDLAGNNLTGKDFTEAFDAACFPLTLFSSSFDPGWSCGSSATAIQGLLGMLVEGGADNVNQCFLEASRFGSTELVRILLQIAHHNSLDVDVDLALGFASHYGKINTMECLVEEGNAMAFLGPLMRAAERGCLPVVQWFVGRGCQDMELCLALTAATSSSQVEVAAYLLPQVPQHVLTALSIEILKAAGERSGGSLEGVAFLLRSDFLGDPAGTYAVADSIARSEDDSVAPELRSFLREHWSEDAFTKGLLQGQEHFVNMIRIINRGESPLCLRDLPSPLRVAIAYMPVYRECVKAGGCLLSQKLRGQLVEAVRRLGGGLHGDATQCQELLAVLKHHLRPFLPGMYPTTQVA